MILLFSGCSAPEIKAVKVEQSAKKIDFLKDVKPILDKRCVTCHSCYNSPCQAKYSSFEGLERGGSKIKVYDALRIKAINPTRLFESAKTTKEWRQKGFYDLLHSKDTNTSYNDSIMAHMLKQKELHPEIVGSYDPENEELLCPRDKKELEEYFYKKPNHAMPYGLPKLKTSETNTILSWLQQGAHGPSVKQNKKLQNPSPSADVEIQKWDRFLNSDDAKHQLTARYLYEHLYLAHIEFKSSPLEFFQLVRSRTPYPKEVDIIATTRVFDDPKTDKFYYRFRKIHSTIVHKTHMVLSLDDEVLARYNELFIKPEWEKKPHLMTYDLDISTNPFLLYAQIPASSRYQFLLDNSNFIIDTFIRGPVCRGQIALNVIHDHFWVMFKDPEFDIGVKNPDFLLKQASNLEVPIKSVNDTVLDAFSNKYRDKYERYYLAKEKLLNKTYPDGQVMESIWKGNKAADAPILTIYRHFNSASVHRGVLGEEPRTMWVIDYAQLERIYYSLVAGYDVFGNVTHQTNIRRYMDFLRIEGESGFVEYMPKNKRLSMFKSWYLGDWEMQIKRSMIIENRGTSIKYKTDKPKSEFIQKVVNNHLLKSTNIKFDKINYVQIGAKLPSMPKEYNNRDDFLRAIRSLTREGIGFIKHITNNGANLAYIRVKQPDGNYKPIYIVVNRWHDNVNSLLLEKTTLNSNKDTIDFLPTSVGSYPNLFVDVDYKDLPDFFDLLKNYDESEKYNKKIKKYFISRSDDKFWEMFDWFQRYLEESEPKTAGLYDLNRYYPKPW
jgi:hypothetical protein